MNIYLLILLRAIHIFAGGLWLGSAIAYLFFVKPSVYAIGPAGPQFMQSLMERRRYPIFMIGSSLLTVLAGLILYWNSSGGFSPGWLITGPGLGYTIGSLASLVAFVVGNAFIGPLSARMGALGQQMAAAGRPPSSAQVGEMATLNQKLVRAEWMDFGMLVLAMLTMATARYWLF